MAVVGLGVGAAVEHAGLVELGAAAEEAVGAEVSSIFGLAPGDLGSAAFPVAGTVAQAKEPVGDDSAEIRFSGDLRSAC